MNSKKFQSTIYNTYEGLNVENSADINSTTSNLKRKLEKKIREIEKLELKDTRLLTETQRQKTSKKDELLQELKNIFDKELEYIEKEKQKDKNKKEKLKKRQKNQNKDFNKIKENLEKEQREYKEKQEEKRNKKLNAHNERWKKRMKEIEEERERQRRNEEQQHRQYEEHINKESNDITDACKLFNINLNELNANNLKKSYRQLMLKYHPDKPGGNEELTKKITSANLLLKEYLRI